MTETIAGRPFWRLVFDKDGDADQQLVAALTEERAALGVTDLVMFSHGWNNGQDTAIRLYQRWFDLLAAHLGAERKVGFVGILWPSQLWRDEPIPDLEPTPRPAEGGGAAATGTTPTVHAGSPTLEPEVLADLKSLFPDGATELDTIAELLASPPTRETAELLFAQLRALHAATSEGFADGEVTASEPGMLDTDRDPVDLFTEFAAKLADTGVEFESEGGAAGGIGDFVSRGLNGAKEALRQLSYWTMKNRAGVVGRTGLGPVIAKLAAGDGGVRVHLVGHSFGGRVVAYALDGLGDTDGSPVRSITLLQGAFSRFAFTGALPFRDGSGALAGRLDRVNGPLSVCFSSHDSALGVMYPLASLAARDDAAEAEDKLFRYRAMGSHGAFDADRQPLGGVGTAYPFQPHRILNLDASEVVTAGGPPSGAHSDIFKTELAWVVATAGGLT
ncbi:serine-threonine protein kinase [Nocardia lijiangensis]|uniref:serine-threonine protein kinase n=1 Tax=Nocardia lijiangensis TaxID=299618 RepID=UPI000830934E|nr:serine-threonine protein kinase [Nocardia lijiangensis]